MVSDRTAAGGSLEGYGDLLDQLKAEVRSARTQAVQAANGELIGLYWRMGRLILDRREDEGWGTRVVQRLSSDLRAEFPEAGGFGPGNLDYVRHVHRLALQPAWDVAPHPVADQEEGPAPTAGTTSGPSPAG